MSAIIWEPTVVASWKTLVEEAEQGGDLWLNQELESYLVYLLVRFTNRPEMVKGALAFEYLERLNLAGQERANALRDLGDTCLLLSGFFPGRAERKQVRVSYFVDIGQSAYAVLSETSKRSISNLYANLSHGFVLLMNVLNAIRELAAENNQLELMDAVELWQDTGNVQFLKKIQRYTKGFPSMLDRDRLKKIKH